jgi:hypothetical protein
MNELLVQVDESTYTFGNYRITHEHDTWLLTPIKPAPHARETWLEGSIECVSRDDAFRIANVFTSQELLSQGVREMFKLIANEQKEK